MELCKINRCTACKACMNVCPKDAISMVTSSTGFTHWKIDVNRCINCKLCQSACPQITVPLKNAPQKCYVAWSTNKEDKMKSASGGVASAIYRYALNHSYIIVGAEMKSDFSVSLRLGTMPSDIEAFRNSKYTYSDPLYIYKEVGKLLQQGIAVIFIGLPCQVAAMKNYAYTKRINDKSLILVDIICHGTAPTVYLQQHIRMIEKKSKKIASSCNFRDSQFGTQNYVFSLRDGEGKLIYKKCVKRNDSYQEGYHKAMIYRENCYNCTFACAERCGDITIGDFSGLGRVSDTDIKNVNVSCILSNTEKGATFLHEMNENKVLVMHERPLKEALGYEKQLSHPSIPSSHRPFFLNLYEEKQDYNYAASRALQKTMMKNMLLYGSHIYDGIILIKKMIPPKLRKRIKTLLCEKDITKR